MPKQADEKPGWSNQPDADMELRRMTPQERHLSELAEKNRNVEPVRYDITSKNPKAIRIVHDFYNTPVVIPPGEKKLGVELHPNIAAHFKRTGSDLELVLSNA